MVFHIAPRRFRLAPLLSLALLAAVVAAPAPTAADDTMTVSAAESAMVAALNADRTSRGLVPVRVDARLMAIARARSTDMVANNCEPRLARLARPLRDRRLDRVQLRRGRPRC